MKKLMKLMPRGCSQEPCCRTLFAAPNVAKRPIWAGMKGDLLRNASEEFGTHVHPLHCKIQLAGRTPSSNKGGINHPLGKTVLHSARMMSGASFCLTLWHNTDAFQIGEQIWRAFMS
eukprot:4305164-Karenia_brevis.AAC.1